MKYVDLLTLFTWSSFALIEDYSAIGAKFKEFCAFHVDFYDSSNFLVPNSVKSVIYVCLYTQILNMEE